MRQEELMVQRGALVMLCSGSLTIRLFNTRLPMIVLFARLLSSWGLNVPDFWFLLAQFYVSFRFLGFIVVLFAVTSWHRLLHALVNRWMLVVVTLGCRRRVLILWVRWKRLQRERPHLCRYRSKRPWRIIFLIIIMMQILIWHLPRHKIVLRATIIRFRRIITR